MGEVLLHVGQDEQFLLLINSIIITVKGDLNPTCFSWKYHKIPINWATKLFINMIDLSVKSHKLGLVEAWWALGSLGYAWYLDWVDWSGSWLGLGYGSLFGTALGGFNKWSFGVCEFGSHLVWHGFDLDNGSQSNSVWIELCALCSIGFVVWARCGYFWAVLEII